MDSPQKAKYSLSTNLLFLFLLLSTNLLTLFFSTTISSSCSFIPKEKSASQMLSESPSTTETTPHLPEEFLAFTSAQKLPFRYNPNFNSDAIYPSAGQACTLFPDELRRFMSYNVNGSCPDDELLAQKLLLKGCEPLPRRRCRPAASSHYVEPYPLPTSYWSTPPDSSVVWTAYTCKNYSCLINRKRNQKGFDDCKDCFDLEGVEKTRWTAKETRVGGLDFAIDEVLATRKPGIHTHRRCTS